jgi:hypothetical protein
MTRQIDEPRALGGGKRRAAVHPEAGAPASPGIQMIPPNSRALRDCRMKHAIGRSAGASPMSFRFGSTAEVRSVSRHVRKVPRGDISELYKWKDRLAAVSPISNQVF